MHGGAQTAGEKKQMEVMQMTESYWTLRKCPAQPIPPAHWFKKKKERKRTCWYENPVTLICIMMEVFYSYKASCTYLFFLPLCLSLPLCAREPHDRRDSPPELFWRTNLIW